MYMYIYIYICIHIYINVYTYIYIHIYTYIYINMCIFYIYIYVYFFNTYKYTYIHIYISIRLCVYTDEAWCCRESVKTQIATFGDCVLSLDAAFQLSSEGTCSTTTGYLDLNYKGIKSLAPGVFANMSNMT